MNFTTDLPKKKPLVTYIVASSVKCQKQSGYDKSKQDNNKKEQDIYRMHAVILFKNSQTKQQQLQSQINNISNNKNEKNEQNNLSNESEKQFILCHIRKIDNSEEDKVNSNKPSTNNNSSASESSQDIAVNFKNLNKKGSLINRNLLTNQIGYEEEDESEYRDENYNDLKENHAQGKRKSSSMNETKSNNADSYFHQTLTPQDLNKQSKSKSKYTNKYQNKLIDNYQRSSFSQTQKQSAITDICPELSTDFLQVKTINHCKTEQTQQQFTQNDIQKKQISLDCINKKTKREDNLNHINLYELQNNNINSMTKNESSSIRNSLTNCQANQKLANNIQSMNILSQNQSPNNQRQRSPGNCEVNSIASSSYTNQIQKNEEDFFNNFVAAAVASNSSCAPSLNFGINNNFINNQMISYAYPQQGGMMMMQPYPSLQTSTTMIPNYFMNMNTAFPQQFIQDQLNIQQIQAAQQQTQKQQQLNQLQLAQQLQLQPNNQLLQNIRLTPTNMEEFCQTFEPNQQVQFIDYLKFYSRQMNTFPNSNTPFIPQTRDSNKQ